MNFANVSYSLSEFTAGAVPYSALLQEVFIPRIVHWRSCFLQTRVVYSRVASNTLKQSRGSYSTIRKAFSKGISIES